VQPFPTAQSSAKIPPLHVWTTHEPPSWPHSEFNRHDCAASPPEHDVAHANVLPVRQQTCPCAQSAASSHWKNHWFAPLHDDGCESELQEPGPEPLAQHPCWDVTEQNCVPEVEAPLQSTSEGSLE
jgi:hypothetical protein